jgi:hypothetical protein
MSELSHGWGNTLVFQPIHDQLGSRTLVAWGVERGRRLRQQPCGCQHIARSKKVIGNPYRKPLRNEWGNVVRMPSNAAGASSGFVNSLRLNEETRYT